MKCAVKVWVSGFVQGVMFRFSTQQQAKTLGLKGYARNLDDGRVEIIAEGDARALDLLLKWLKRGPPTAKVRAFRHEPTYLHHFKTFEVR